MLAIFHQKTKSIGRSKPKRSNFYRQFFKNLDQKEIQQNYLHV